MPWPSLPKRRIDGLDQYLLLDRRHDRLLMGHTQLSPKPEPPPVITATRPLTPKRLLIERGSSCPAILHPAVAISPICWYVCKVAEVLLSVHLLSERRVCRALLTLAGCRSLQHNSPPEKENMQQWKHGNMRKQYKKYHEIIA